MENGKTGDDQTEHACAPEAEGACGEESQYGVCAEKKEEKETEDNKKPGKKFGRRLRRTLWRGPHDECRDRTHKDVHEPQKPCNRRDTSHREITDAEQAQMFLIKNMLAFEVVHWGTLCSCLIFSVTAVLFLAGKP